MHQDQWTAALDHLQHARSEGCRESFCFRSLTRALLALGNQQDAVSVLDEWQQVDPQNRELQTYLDAVAKTDSSAGRIDGAAPTAPAPSIAAPSIAAPNRAEPTQPTRS